MSKEDTLLDLYKIYAYNPNDAVDNPLTPFGNFCKGYEACEAEQSKRIAELQTQNAELVEAFGNVRTATSDLHEDESSKQLINRIVKIRGLVDIALASCLTKQKNV